MPLINVDGKSIDVNIRGELEQFDWIKPDWRERKLLAASPFRYDKSPSFFVDLETGGWSDSGAYDEDYEHGNLPKLLAFLRSETIDETNDYLKEVYGKAKYSDGYALTPLQLRKERKRIVLPESTLDDLTAHDYLSERGIKEKVQEVMGVGYSPSARAIAIPWRHEDGTLANCKYRKVQGKAFWYVKGAEPIGNLVYGIDVIYKHNIRTAYICEAEVDAMSIMTAGKAAIAIGGASVTDKQIEKIRKSPIERVVIATDNDKAGRKVRNQLVVALKPYVSVSEIALPSDLKDVNEVLTRYSANRLREIVGKGLTFNRLSFNIQSGTRK